MGMMARMAQAQNSYGTVSYYLPGFIDPDAHVVPFIGISRKIKYFSVKVKDELKFYTYHEHFCPVIFEGYAFKHHRMCQMYQVTAPRAPRESL